MGSVSYTGEALAAFTLINAERTALGLGVLRESATLRAAALGHSNYLSINNDYEAALSTQASGRTGFTGATFAARLTAAAFSGTAAETVIGPSFSGEDSARAALATAYQRMALLRHGLTGLGVGFVTPGSALPAGTPSVVPGGIFSALVTAAGVPSSATPQDMLATAGGVSVFPRDGASDVPLIMFRDEPNPVQAELGAWTSGRFPGYPVSLQVTSDKTLTVTSFTISRVAAGGNVPLLAKLLKSDDTAFFVPNGITNFATIVPLAPLDAGATYEISFSGNASGTPVTRTWRFTARAGFTAGTARRTSSSRVLVPFSSPSGILRTAQIISQTGCGANYVSNVAVQQSTQTVAIFENVPPATGCVVRIRVTDLGTNAQDEKDVAIP